MSDPRTTPWSGRVAHFSLRGQVEEERFIEGETHRIAAPITDILSAPGGGRERQLLRGEGFQAIDARDGHFYGFALRDGYCGWVEASAFVGGPSEAPTHRLSAARSYGKSTTGLKQMGRVTPLSFGALLSVLDDADGWARVAWGRGTAPRDLYVPLQHLNRLDAKETDAATVAERLIGTPYLWGGNSAFGIDCSGLVQAALLACGCPCPGDSDLQEQAFDKIDRAEARRGDLVFWRGHVGMLTDPATLIHANAHHMAVAIEPLAQAIARIGQKEFGAVTSFRRP